MRFSIVAAVSILATITSAANTILNPAEGEKVPAGKPYLIKWEADTPGPVAINLRRGESANLQDLGQIVMLEFNWGNYSWSVPADQEAGNDYALELKWGADPGPNDVNYSQFFEIVSGNSGDKPTTTVNRNSTQTATKKPRPTGSATGTISSDTPSPTGKKPTESSNPNKTSSSPTQPVPSGGAAPGAFGASAASVAAVVAVAAAVLFN